MFTCSVYSTLFNMKDQKRQSILLHSLNSFCQRTTLDGWSYVSNENTIFKRFIWFMALSGFLIFASYLLYLNIQVYIKSTTITSLDTTTAPLDDLTFPSMQICNLNQVTASFIESLGSFSTFSLSANTFYREFIYGSSKYNSTGELNRIQKITERLKKVYDWDGSSQIRKISSPPCHDMLLSISRNVKTVTSYEAYKATSDAGMCCMIVPHWLFNEKRPNYSTNYWNVQPKDMKHGLINGFRYLLDAETFDYDYRKSASTGFRIFIGDARDAAAITQKGISIAVGTDTNIRFSVTKTFATNDAIINLDPKERKCYLDSEIQLPLLGPEGGFRYSDTNCYFESVIQNVVKNCSCISDWAYSAEGIGYPDLKYCQGADIKCAELWENNENNERAKILESIEVTSKHGRKVKKQCLSRCERDEFHTAVSSSTYPNYFTFQHRKDICYVFKKVYHICHVETMSKRAQFLDFYEDVLQKFENHNTTLCDVIYKAYHSENMCKNSHISNLDLKRNKRLVKFLFQYAKDNVAYVKVYMGDQFYTRIDMDQDITWLDFFNSVGGLLGLCLGLSLVSIFELFYHIIQLFFTLLK